MSVSSSYEKHVFCEAKKSFKSLSLCPQKLVFKRKHQQEPLLIFTRSHYQKKSSAPEIKAAANSEMYHSDGLKILNLDFTIFCCDIFYSINFIVLCSDLKSRKVYRGYSFTR